MGINITAVGYGLPELPQDRISSGQSRGKPVENKLPDAAYDASLQGNKGEADLQKSTSELEKISLAFNKKLRFEVNRELEEIIVKVIDPETDKVIKELPPEEIQHLHLRIKEMIGLLFDERV